MLRINSKNVSFSGTSTIEIEDNEVQIATMNAEFNEPNLYLNFNIGDFKNYKFHQTEVDKDFEDFKNNVIQAL